MRITANQLWEYLKKYWFFIILFIAGLAITTILDHFFGCNFVIVRDVKQCTVFGQSTWEWIKLLIGPVLVVITGILLNRFFKFRDENKLKQDKEIEVDRIRQKALTKYFNRMTHLLMSEEWKDKNEISQKNNIPVSDLPIVAITQAITLATLNELDSKRIRSLIIFLFDSKALNHISLKNANLKGADLRGLILCNADFSHADLSGSDLFKADLRKANLRDAFLSTADFSGANLSSADLNFAVLKNANLSYANLSYANLSYADLSGAELDGADLSGAELNIAVLKDANLSYADLSYANLSSTKFCNAILSQANLSGANLRGADLSGANLRGADLSGADLNGTNFKSVKIHNIESIKYAECWHKAKYDEDTRQYLGLPTTTSPDQPE